jgi:hypothetical protein
MAPPVQNLKSLEEIVQSAAALVSQLQAVLVDIHKSPSIPNATSEQSPALSPQANALTAARDSATLIRAHATKISLLIINEPFTPSALVTVVRDLISGPVPGLAASVQSCDPSSYTAVVRRELAWRSKTVLSELGQLLAQIPKDGKIVASDKQKGFAADGKGSISTTGVLWSACDDVIGLANMGVAGFFVKKVEEWRDTLKDVMEELKEWGDEEPDDDEDDEDDDDDDEQDAHSDDGDESLPNRASNGHQSAQDMLDSFMDSQRTIPRSDPDHIRPRLESSLKRVRLVTLLFQAIVKRRIKKLPALPPGGDDAASATVPERLDEAAKVLTKLPDQFGDLACAFYELDADEIDKAADQCFLDAFAASELLSKTWDGSSDEFTEWTKKFQAEIRKE